MPWFGRHGDSECTWIDRHFGIDTRALATVRILLGCLVVIDLGLRAPHLRTFYTDAGVLPRTVLRELYPVLAHLSLHTVSGGFGVVALSFVFAGILAGSLSIGYRSRLCAGLLVVFYGSLFARNPLVLHGGDGLLLTGLLLSVFLPIGARWGIEASRDATSNQRITNLATVTILVQLVLLYAVNAIFKLQSDVWLEGNAIQHVLQLEQFSVRLGPTLAAQDGLTSLLTWAWIGLLALGPFLVVTVGRVRLLLILGFALFHIGMLATMQLGLFPLVVLTLLLLYIPECAWDAVESQLPRVAIGPENPHNDQRASSEAHAGTKRIVSGMLVIVLVGSLLWPAGAVGAPVPGPAEAEYPYTLFAPQPTQASEWLVLSATTTDGEAIHPIAGWERDGGFNPSQDTSPGVLWEQYSSEIRFGSETTHNAFGEYLCRSADAHVEQVESVRADRVSEPTAVIDGDRTTRVLVEQQC